MNFRKWPLTKRSRTREILLYKAVISVASAIPLFTPVFLANMIAKQNCEAKTIS